MSTSVPGRSASAHTDKGGQQGLTDSNQQKVHLRRWWTNQGTVQNNGHDPRFSRGASHPIVQSSRFFSLLLGVMIFLQEQSHHAGVDREKNRVPRNGYPEGQRPVVLEGDAAGDTFPNGKNRRKERA